MTSNKYIGDRWFCYSFNKITINHGLYNSCDKIVGYCYQNKEKGFWLTNLL